MTSKKTFFVSIDLLKDSTDQFRNFIGGFYENTEVFEDERLRFYDWSRYPKINGETSRVYFGIPNPFDNNYNGISEDYTKIVPSYTFPIRIAASDNKIENDEQWRSFIIGGTYGDESYDPVVSSTAHEYLKITYDFPYTKLESQQLLDAAAYQTIDISCDYNQHIPRYQNKVSSFENDLYLPNYYILSDYYSKRSPNMTEVNKLYPKEMLDWISLENTYRRPEYLFSFNDKRIPYSVPTPFIDSFTEVRKLNTNLTVDYLPSSRFLIPSGSSVQNWATTKQKNIFIDDKALLNLRSLNSLQDCLPYKIKIVFPSKTAGNFNKTLVANNFDSKLLASLSDAFTTEQIFSTTNISLTSEQQYYTNTDNVQSLQTGVESGEFKQIDYVDLLVRARNNYINPNSDCMFVGENNLERLSALDNDGIYRHINTLITTEAFANVTALMRKPDMKIKNIGDLYSKKEVFQDTVAYRVEKIAGPLTGDSLTQDAIQNYWFVNSENLFDFNFFDSQIRYDTDYTYKVYAYVLVGGYKYEYSDLRLTRNIACADLGTGGYHNGLEFYDPLTDEAVDQLYEGSGPWGTGGSFSSGSVVTTDYKYFADFNLTYEPFLKVIEMPIHTKTLRVLDNPPDRLNIFPFQILDDSQRIGFFLRYNGFNSSVFPSPITPQDEDIKQNYLNSRNITEETKITLDSISKQKTIQVFKMDSRPNNLQDFSDKLYKTIDLSYADSSVAFKMDEVCYDQIATNKKYYYSFRVLNELGIPGTVSEIYEVELINDGGYKFALFNVILESELEQPPPKTSEKSCKKIFQLKPNISQISLNTEGVDYSQDSNSQISNVTIGTADDLIWDKTFKVRLTSKKTSRKIDLNITYKISSE